MNSTDAFTNAFTRASMASACLPSIVVSIDFSQYQHLHQRCASDTDNWGFKTPIQFKVAQALAGRFYHAWGVVQRKARVKSTISYWGHIIETKMVDPSTPAEAASWVEEDNLLHSPTGQRYGIPTPQWESGSGTFGVVVDPDGGYTMTHEGLLWVDYSPEGEQIDAGLVPGWYEWHQNPKGRGRVLGVAMRLACAKGVGGGVQKAEFIRLFEADADFWKSGFVAGSRWYEWFPGSGPDMA